MATSAVTRQNLDDALTQLVTNANAGFNTILNSIQDLEAKIAAGTVTTPEDFSAELAQINTLATDLSTSVASATAADPGPQTPPAA